MSVIHSGQNTAQSSKLENTLGIQADQNLSGDGQRDQNLTQIQTLSSNEASNSSPRSNTPLCVLIVLDGLGIWPRKNGNAVLRAKTPNLDLLWTNCRHSLLKASDNDVGLPIGYPGNSEVGHLNLGSGQIVYQSLSKINDSIRTGKFKRLPNLRKTFREVKKRKTNLHLMGILSAGGVHGHIEHLFEILKICKQKKIDPFIHVFLDGRDTGNRDGFLYLSMLNEQIRKLKVGRIASLNGRFYAMDRNSRWERTEKAYNAMLGIADRFDTDPMRLLQSGYKNNEDDYTFIPSVITDENGSPVGPLQDNDVVIFWNYREDRARQIIKALVLEEWSGSDRINVLNNLWFLTMTGYSENLPIHILFEPHHIKATVSSVISRAGYNQLHIAETEKGAHVTYFFNGGREEPNPGEEFFVVPSEKVQNYAQVPEMSAQIIRDEVIYRLEMNKYHFILVNFANPDMLGHTGKLDATVKGIEVVDKCVGDIVRKTVELGGDFIITADHGNCEIMIDESTGLEDTSHTLNPVPLIIGKGLTHIPQNGKARKLGTGESTERGILSDVGVTALAMLGLKPSEEMMGIDLYSLLPKGPLESKSAEID